MGGGMLGDENPLFGLTYSGLSGMRKVTVMQ